MPSYQSRLFLDGVEVDAASLPTPPGPPPAEVRQQPGVVTSFDDDAGWGVIRLLDGTEVWTHFAAVPDREGWHVLCSGEHVDTWYVAAEQDGYHYRAERVVRR